MTVRRLFVLGVLTVTMGLLALSSISPAFAAQVDVLPFAAENHTAASAALTFGSSDGARLSPSLDVTGTVPVSGTKPVTGTGTITGSVKVATAISKYYTTTVEAVMALHQEGYGYGEIVKAYALAAATGQSVEDILSLREADQGWGVILKTLAVAKWDTSLGKIIQSNKTVTGTVTTSGKKGEQQNQGKGNSGQGLGPTKPTVGQPNLGTGSGNSLNSNEKGNPGKGIGKGKSK